MFKNRKTKETNTHMPEERTFAETILGAFNDVQKKMIWTAAVWLVILVVVGLLLLIRPDAAMTVICRVIGGMVMIFGILQLIRFAMSGMDGIPGVDLPALFLGILLTVVGFYIARSPEVLVSIAAVIVAIFLLTHGVFSLAQMLRLHLVRDAIWWISIIGSAITVILGLVFLFAPLESSKVAMQIAGLALIYAAFAGFLLALKAGNTVKTAGERVSATVQDVQDEYERRTGVDAYGQEIVDEDAVIRAEIPEVQDKGEF